MRPIFAVAGVCCLVALYAATPAVAQQQLPLPKCFQSEAQRASYDSQLRDLAHYVAKVLPEARNPATRASLQAELTTYNSEIAQLPSVRLCAFDPRSPAGQKALGAFGESKPGRPNN